MQLNSTIKNLLFVYEMCLIAKEVSKGGTDAIPCALIVYIMRRMMGLCIHDDIPLWVECHIYY